VPDLGAAELEDACGIGGKPGMVLDSFLSCVARRTHRPPPHWGDIMGRSLRLLAGLALGAALASTTAIAAAAQPSQPTSKDQNNRETVSPLVEEAWRSREAVERFRSGERNFVPDPDIIGHPVDLPQARPAPAPAPIVSRPGVGVVASLLLGLVGGLAGGAAALVGWAAATRRRPRQPASVT
jgi:hypothetical protein